MLKKWLAAHGVESELIGPDPDRRNLVATVTGRGDGPSLALCGHLDVVPAGELDAWQHPPFAGVLDDDGFVWGRGAVDMKAQVATRAAALVALVQSGITPAAGGGRRTTHHLARRAHRRALRGGRQGTAAD